MTTYFRPDRSNRPSGDTDPMNFSYEVCTPGEEDGGVLADGRPYVTETAFVEGYTLGYYYFDVAGLENASQAELQALLERSNIRLTSETAEVSLGAIIVKDAQGRPIWEFQVAYLND